MIWIALMLACAAGAYVDPVLGAYAIVCAAIAQAELNIARSRTP